MGAVSVLGGIWEIAFCGAGGAGPVWKLDRLGRSVKEVLMIADDLHARGIAVRILTAKLAGSYPPAGEGKFFITMMAAFAGLERGTSRERTMAGLAAAKAQGRTGDRPAVMDADKLAAASARREPRQDRRGPRRQPRLGLPPSGRRGRVKPGLVRFNISEGSPQATAFSSLT